jgi:hypothetical protein
MKHSEPRLFVTDYASYNEGTQFEFGHWVDLNDFSDADGLMDYINDHFEECDKKRPLFGGSPREEIMFTDYECFPSQLYSESMSYKEMEALYEWINLEDKEKVKVAYLLDQGYDMSQAMSDYDGVYMREYDGTIREKYDLFEEYYPAAYEADDNCPYLEINYDRFIRERFNEFEYEGTTYLVQSN